MSVTFADAAPSGIGSMLGGLIEQNLARDPTRTRLLRSSIVSISAPDAGVAVTLRISLRGVEIADGADPRANLSISAPSSLLLELTGAPLRFGLPDALRPEGRTVIRHLIARRVRVRGLLRHPVRLARLTALLSAR